MARSGKYLYYCTSDGAKCCVPLYTNTDCFGCVIGYTKALNTYYGGDRYYTPISVCDISTLKVSNYSVPYGIWTLAENESSYKSVGYLDLATEYNATTPTHVDMGNKNPVKVYNSLEAYYKDGCMESSVYYSITNSNLSNLTSELYMRCKSSLDSGKFNLPESEFNYICYPEYYNNKIGCYYHSVGYCYPTNATFLLRRPHGNNTVHVGFSLRDSEGCFRKIYQVTSY